jgi:hypothetical protein
MRKIIVGTDGGGASNGGGAFTGLTKAPIAASFREAFRDGPPGSERVTAMVGSIAQRPPKSRPDVTARP